VRVEGSSGAPCGGLVALGKKRGGGD
jgi:hypothetical protein